MFVTFISIHNHRHVGDSDVVDVDVNDDARLRGGGHIRTLVTSGHWASSRLACVRGHV